MNKILIIIILMAFCSQSFGQIDSVSLDETVISASKFSEAKSQVPNQIEVITSSDAAFYNSSTAADLLFDLGGIGVQKSQMGGGSPIIRGFEASRVLIVVDGVRMNNAIFRAGHLQNVLRLDNSILDRTEIIFGPGSLVYGSDALGGVMHFRTKNPDFYTGDGKLGVKANAMLRFASASLEKTGHVDFSLAGKRWSSLTSFSITDFGDLRQGRAKNPFNNGIYSDIFDRGFYVVRAGDHDSAVVNTDPHIQKGSAYRQYNLLQKIRFQQSETVEHALAFYYSNTTDVPRYDRLTEGDVNAPAYAEWYYGPETWLNAQYRLSINPTDFGLLDNLNVVVAYQQFKESRHSRRFNAARLKRQYEKVDAININLDAVKNVGRLRLNYGLEYFYNDVNSTAYRLNVITGDTTSADTRYPDGGNTMSSVSAYVAGKLAVGEKVFLNGGLRYNYTTLKSIFATQEFFPFPFNEAKQNTGALTGNLGLVVLPGNGFRLSVLFSTGYRVPNVDDMTKVFDSSPGQIVVPNPNLKPEYVYNGELTLGKRFGELANIEVTGFYTRMTNAISLNPGMLNGQDSIDYDGVMSAVYMATNNASAYITGGTLGFSVTPATGLRFYGNVGYTYGRIPTDSVDQPLDHISPLTGKVALSYTRSKIRAEIYSIFNGWKRLEDYKLDGEDNLVYATPDGMPAWFTLNLKATWQFYKGLSVDFGVENILDTQYRTFASGMSAAGRNFVVALRGSF